MVAQSLQPPATDKSVPASMQQTAVDYRSLTREWHHWTAQFNSHIHRLRGVPDDLYDLYADDEDANVAPNEGDGAKTLDVLNNPFPADFLPALTSTIIPCSSQFFRHFKLAIKDTREQVDGEKAVSCHAKHQRWSKSCIDDLIAIVDLIHDIQKRRHHHLNSSSSASLADDNSRVQPLLSTASLAESDSLWAPGEMEVWMLVCQLMAELDTWMEQFEAGIPDMIRDAAIRSATDNQAATSNDPVNADGAQAVAPGRKQRRNRQFRVYSGITVAVPPTPTMENKQVEHEATNPVSPDSPIGRRNNQPQAADSTSSTNGRISLCKSKRISTIPETVRQRWVISFIGNDETVLKPIMDEIKRHVDLSVHHPSSAAGKHDSGGKAIRKMSATMITPTRGTRQQQAPATTIQSECTAQRPLSGRKLSSSSADKPLPPAPEPLQILMLPFEPTSPTEMRRGSDAACSPRREKHSFGNGLKKWLTAPTKISGTRKNIPAWMRPTPE